MIRPDGARGIELAGVPHDLHDLHGQRRAAIDVLDRLWAGGR